MVFTYYHFFLPRMHSLFSLCATSRKQNSKSFNTFIYEALICLSWNPCLVWRLWSLSSYSNPLLAEDAWINWQYQLSKPTGWGQFPWVITSEAHHWLCLFPTVIQKDSTGKQTIQQDKLIWLQEHPIKPLSRDRTLQMVPKIALCQATKSHISTIKIKMTHTFWSLSHILPNSKK